MGSNTSKKAAIRPVRTDSYKISVFKVPAEGGEWLKGIRLDSLMNPDAKPAFYDRTRALALVEALQTGIGMMDDLI